MATTYTWETTQRERKRVIQVRYPGKQSGRTRNPNEVSCKTPQPHTRRMRTIVERLIGNPGYSNFNRRFTTKLSTRGRLQNRTQDYRKIDNTDKGGQGGTRSLSYESGQRDEESRFRVQVLGGRKERERGATNKERRDQSEHCDEVFGSTGNTQQTR